MQCIRSILDSLAFSHREMKPFGAIGIQLYGQSLKPLKRESFWREVLENECPCVLFEHALLSSARRWQMSVP